MSITFIFQFRPGHLSDGADPTFNGRPFLRRLSNGTYMYDNYFFDTILKGLPIQGLPMDLSLILEASRLKAKYPLSYTDCFAAAQAIRSEASILTGDPEFKAVEKRGKYLRVRSSFFTL